MSKSVHTMQRLLIRIMINKAHKNIAVGFHRGTSRNSLKRWKVECLSNSQSIPQPSYTSPEANLEVKFLLKALQVSSTLVSSCQNEIKLM